MDWKKRWTALAEFLGQALGSDYEIAVHDFTGEEPRLLALVNPQVSGRAQNAPPSNLALDFWRSGVYNFQLVLVTEDGRVVVTDGLTDELTKVEGNGYTYETVS